MYQPQKIDMEGTFTFLPIEDVHYGQGCSANLGSTLAKHGVERALLISSNTLATKTPLVERLQENANGRIGDVFHETVQHVHRGSVLRAAEHARSINADGIVTFGGGTPNDTGKAVLLALAEGIEDHDGFNKSQIKFEYPSTVEIPSVKGNTVPLVAVSTTLSAGEFTHFIGITDEVRKVKDLYLDKKLAGNTVFLDPELTLETPMWLWLSTGMRSVDHCVEAICSNTAHPFTDALAIRALSMLNRYLRECMNNPNDLAARTQAHIAAWMSVCGLANVTLGLSHGIGHQLGARNNVPHGHTSCVMLNPTMEFNRDHVGDRQVWIGEAMGIDTSTMSPEEASAAARESVLQLVKDLEQPYRLRDVGVEPNDFPLIAKDALEDIIVASNPRPVSSADEVVNLLQEAY